MASPIIFSGRRSKLLTADGLLRADGGINDYDGVPNYIKNGHAEVNTTGWATYADAAGSVPVDGTGGAANITWTRSTSSPARGQASFLFTKDAVNRQGQGASYDFTIDRADRAKVLRISGVYEIMSGTYSGGSSSTNSDLIVYIFDVTNGTLIEPAPMKLDGGVIGTQYTFNSTFQSASNSSSYRLIFHCSTTSASAFTINFDSITVGPQVVSIGGSIGDTTSYTPTYTGFGTVSTSTVTYRKVGDCLEINGRFTSGTSTAVEARVSLPAGLTIDATKVPTSQDRGHWWASNPTVIPGAILAESGAAYVTFTSGASATNSFAKLNGTAVAASSEVVGFFVTVPIAGWGTSQILSSETDTRIIIAQAAGNPASAAAGNPIIFPTTNFDSHGAYSPSTGKFTAPFPGYYRVHGYLNSASAAQAVSIYVDGVSSVYVCSLDSNGEAAFTGTVKVNAGQTIDLRPDSILDVGVPSVINFEKVSGPSQIAASETVCAVYKCSGAPTFTVSTTVRINFDTKEEDTHSAVTTGASWIFTAPISGLYSVCSAMTAVVPVSTGVSFQVKVFKNGSLHSSGPYDNYVTSSGAANAGMSFPAKEIRLVAGDTLDIRVTNDNLSRAMTATTAENWVAIKRIGN